MYADYSPLEDERNLVEIIKEFTSLASRIGRMEVDSKKLAALLSDSDRLRQDIIAAIKNIRTDTTFTMDKFHDEHVDVLSNELLTRGAALLTDTKDSLAELLKNTETGFDEQHARYRDKVALMINENNSAASDLVQTWLAADSMYLPRPILTNLSVTAGATLDRNSGSKNYETFRTTASAATVQAGDSAQKGTDALQFSYTFRVDPSELEFWNYRRIVTDLGIRELLLPAGMKAPVSERIKQSFRFGSRKDAEVMREPEFIKADGYSLVAASLNDNKTLVVELAKDPSKPEESGLFKITYDVASLSVPGQQHASTGAKPRIDYIVQDGGNLIAESDLLQIAEIQKNSDMSKLHLLGSAVLARIRTLQDPQVIRSRGTLTELRTRNDIVIPSGQQEGNYRALLEFLESIAFSYAPFVKKMQEKTSVQGELVLREELGGGQRKEYSVRVDDLRSQLKDTENGKMIAAAMGL